MRLVDLVLSWLRVSAKPKPVKRTYDRVLHEPCGRTVATSATSPKRHRCKAKAEVGT